MLNILNLVYFIMFLIQSTKCDPSLYGSNEKRYLQKYMSEFIETFNNSTTSTTAAPEEDKEDSSEKNMFFNVSEEASIADSDGQSPKRRAWFWFLRKATTKKVYYPKMAMRKPTTKTLNYPGKRMYPGNSKYPTSNLTQYQKQLYDKMDAVRMGSFSVAAIELCRIMIDKPVYDLDRVKDPVFNYLTQHMKSFEIFGEPIYNKLIEIFTMVQFSKGRQFQRLVLRVHNRILHRHTNMSEELNDVINTADEFFMDDDVVTHLFYALEQLNMYPKTTSQRQRVDVDSYRSYEAEREEQQFRRSNMDESEGIREKMLVKLVLDAFLQPVLSAQGSEKFNDLKLKITNVIFD